MSFAEAIRTCFSKYTDFSGRAARPEFWYFVLFSIIVDVAFWLLLFVVAMMAGPSGNSGVALISLVLTVLWLVVQLALLVPQLAVLVRRLHDTNRSAWWILVALIPFGSLILLFLCVQEGDAGTNLYGPPPGQPAWNPDMPESGPGMGVPDGSADGLPGAVPAAPGAAIGGGQAINSEHSDMPKVYNRPAGLPVMPAPPRLPAPRTPVTEEMDTTQTAGQ